MNLVLNLKAKHQDTVIARILSKKSISNYHNKEIAPFYNSMEKWERKEYEACEIDRIKQLKCDKNHILDNESLFNEILSEYNLTVIVFIAKIEL